MVKKNKIHFEDESPTLVIGLASDEKIWKLCWEINNALGISMQVEETDMERLQGQAFYSDYESDAEYEFELMENTVVPSKLSPLARKFRYWLIIRSKKEEFNEPTAIFNGLSGIQIINLVHDISGEKNIQKYTP